MRHVCTQCGKIAFDQGICDPCIVKMAKLMRKIATPKLVTLPKVGDTILLQGHLGNKGWEKYKVVGGDRFNLEMQSGGGRVKKMAISYLTKNLEKWKLCI